MDPAARYLAAVRGEPVDRVPLILEGFHFATRAAVEAHPDPGRREIGHRVFDDMIHYVEQPAYVNRYLVTPPQCMAHRAEEIGRGVVRTTTTIHTPIGDLTAVTERNAGTDTVWTVRYPAETAEDVARLASVPWERPEGLSSPDLDALPAGWRARGVLQAKVSSPVVCVGGMMPYDRFLELCAADLPLVTELTEECARRILDVLDVLFSRPGIEYLWIGGCEWLTPPMGSPRLYEALVQPYEAAIIAKAHAHGAACHVHCHGRVRSTLPLVVARGADYFEPMEPPPDGDLTMAEGKSLAAGRMTLGGNIEARLLAHGDVDDVERATREAFAGGKERMVLQTSAGPLAEMTPRMVANYHRMLDVWEEMSPL